MLGTPEGWKSQNNAGPRCSQEQVVARQSCMDNTSSLVAHSIFSYVQLSSEPKPSSSDDVSGSCAPLVKHPDQLLIQRSHMAKHKLFSDLDAWTTRPTDP